jgi:predicted nucleic acid-binding protein
MSDVYVLDACALIAVLSKETGANRVVEIYDKAKRGEIALVMHKMNLFEVYYDVYRNYDKGTADGLIAIFKDTPVKIISEITDEIFFEAGRLKAVYKISVADAIALATASVMSGSILTADHHEFDAIEQSGERIKFFWIRSKRSDSIGGCP